MRDAALFLGKFLRHGTAIASLAPSSPWLSEATVRNVDWAGTRTIVELGAGTGPITRVIAQRIAPGTRFLAIERDHDFAEILREKFAGQEGVEILEADVRDLSAILADRGIERADAIISGLPVPSFPKDLQKDLFRVVGETLAPGGTFNQITEMPLVYWRFYRRQFEEVRFVFEPRNFPPAGAYHCKGPKSVG
jgi:phosphatidylethanolamine/phosphatidyl-N-methylethanolamine N-methyltransferase